MDVAADLSVLMARTCAKSLRSFSGLALSTQDLRKLIVRTAVMIMREIALQNLFSSGIVLLRCVGVAQLLVCRPEIGLAANCQLEMRNCLCCAIFRDKNGAQFPVGLGMSRIDFQLTRQFRECMIGIAMFPVKMTEPEVYVGKIRTGCGHGKIFGEGLLILLAVDIKLAQQLMHMIGIRRDSEQTGNLRHGDLTTHDNQLIARGKIAGMKCQPAKKRGLGRVIAVLMHRIHRLGESTLIRFRDSRSRGKPLVGSGSGSVISR